MRAWRNKLLRVTFEVAADRYVEAGGSARFLTPLRQRFGTRSLRSLRPADLDEAAHALHPDASRETIIRQVYTPFIAIWNHAARQQWVEPRLWPKPRKPKGTAVVQRASRAGSKPIDYETAARFVLEMSPAPAYVMTALFYTGMRPIELFALECDDVNVAGLWIVVRSSKTGDPRGVPMHDFLAPLFESLRQRGGKVFRTPRGDEYPLTDNAAGRGGGQLKTAILGARRRSGIDGVSPYTARHSCSTQLVLAGVHPHVKDQILGHVATDMSRRYTSIPQAPLIDAINKLPVPAAWRGAAWWADPLGNARKIIEWHAPGREKRRAG